MLVMSYSLQLSQWFGNIGEVIFYGVLLVTNYRLYRIFYNKKLVQQVSSEACWLFLSSHWSTPPIRLPTSSIHPYIHTITCMLLTFIHQYTNLSVHISVHIKSVCICILDIDVTCCVQWIEIGHTIRAENNSWRAYSTTLLLTDRAISWMTSYYWEWFSWYCCQC